MFKILSAARLILLLFLPAIASAQLSTEEFRAILDSAGNEYDKSHLKNTVSILNSVEYDTAMDYPDHLHFRYLYYKSEAYVEFRDFVKSDSLLRMLEPIAKKWGDTSGLARYYSVIGSLRSFQNRGAESLKYLRKGLAIADSSSDLYQRVLTNLSNAYGILGDYHKQLEMLNKQVDYFNSEGDTVTVATIYNNIGLLYIEHLDENAKGIQSLRRSVELNRALQLKSGLSKNYINMGLGFQALDQLDSALHYLKKARKLKMELNSRGSLAIVLYNLAECYIKMGLLDSASKNYRSSLQLSRENNIPVGLIHNHVGLTRIYLKQKKFNDALGEIQQAVSIVENAPENEIKLSVYNYLNRVYDSLGQYDKALKAHREFTAIKDSIFSEAKSKELQKQRALFENRLTKAENENLKKQQKIDRQKLESNRIILISLSILLFITIIFSILLYRSNDQRKKLLKEREKYQEQLEEQYQISLDQKEKLENLNAIKNKILSVMGHDLRSPLSSIYSVLGMIENDELTREEMLGIVSQLKLDTHMTLGTLENILQWARLQDNSEYVQKDLHAAEFLCDPIVNSLKSYAQTKNVSINFERRAKQLWADQNQFSSVLRNITTNALKFSPENGEVKVIIDENGDYSVLEVHDQGEGMPDEIIASLQNKDKVESKQGTGGEKGTGIGLKLAKDFIEAHGGYFKIEKPEEGSGTIFKAYFPKQNRD